MVFFADAIEFVTRLSTDTLVLVFLIIGLSVVALYLGKDWIVSFIFSLFVAEVLYQIIPFDLPDSDWYIFGTKIIFAFVIAAVLKKFIKGDFPYKKSRRYIQAVILGVTTTITLLATGLTTAYTFSPFISRWFEGDFLFWASLVPFLILFFIIRR